MDHIDTDKPDVGRDGTVKESRTLRGPSWRTKHDRIVAAARKLFAENGYDETSMEAIARQAGVGKATLYSHFTCKEDLFTAIVSIEGEEHYVKLTLARPLFVAEDLHEFGRAAFALLVAPQNAAILRMVAAEAHRFPDLGRIFFETGPSRLVDRVAKYLERADATGQLSIPDPKLAALQFLALITAEVRMPSLLGILGPMDDATAQRAADAGVQIFLRAYRPDPPAHGNGP